ncbi:hypothetical protein [Coxiella endosymbiont of Ornithodoros amblus]|uniref:hypothetical protein n=1 Tax=Coxiella endosymbiont of Ornithodoros amblus TaxID=1656166 RepID=UPI00244E3E1A|nr:hypothetical protein [Coxiella endosymbiont of Ornithodoros amblus]
MPIWFGEHSSVKQMVIERLDGTYKEADSKTGQFSLYGKVGGVIVTDNEDRAHNAAGTTLFNLSHLSCTIPPNSDYYWVGAQLPGQATSKSMATNIFIQIKVRAIHTA